MNYKYKNYRIKKNRVLFRTSVIVLSVLVVAFVFFAVITIVNKNIVTILKHKELKKLYKDLFKEKNYIKLISKMDVELKKSPFSQKYLVYRGYSYLLLGEETEEIDKQNNFFTLSLLDLRKALAIGVPEKSKSNAYFCLGKIYYYFGESYYWQSLDYLKRSFEMGNKRVDLYYLLGLVYSHLGEYDKSTEIFEEALGYEESEMLLLAIANSYVKGNEYQNAEKYLDRIIKISSSPGIREKAFMLMGEMLFNEKKYNESKKYFDKVIELNENNASAYFYRGEIFYNQNDHVRARSQWRKTIEIDPSHVKALKRIY